MIWVIVGAAYSNQLLAVALKGDAKPPASWIDSYTISIIGPAIDYKGTHGVIVTDSKQFKRGPRFDA